MIRKILYGLLGLLALLVIVALVPDEEPAASDKQAARDKPAVWMTHRNRTIRNTYASPVQTLFHVVYPDGEFLTEIPAEGLFAFDRAAAKARGGLTWGRFVLSGSHATFTTPYETVEADVVSPTQMKKRNSVYSFYKSANVDGLKLDGGFSTIQSWASDPYYRQSGCRQVIYFRRDGTFDDRGAFVGNCNAPAANPPDAPGTGRYELRDFTLILNYADGRVVHRSFTGASDRPAGEGDLGVFIARQLFYRG